MITPHLHAYAMPPEETQKTPMLLEEYRDIYQSVVAGDRPFFAFSET